jgi:tetratricopeptide (TPR) repeat protein
LSAVAARAQRGKVAMHVARERAFRRLVDWARRRSTRSHSPTPLEDQAVQLASFLDDGERRDRQLLELREQAFGPDHPDVATALHILAARYHLVHRYAQADALYNRALTIRTESLGPGHASTVEVLEDLGDLWRDRGDATRAWHAYELALSGTADPDRRKLKRVDYLARLMQVPQVGEPDAPGNHPLGGAATRA